MSAPNKCPRCNALTVSIRNRSSGGTFFGCPNFGKGCKPGTGPYKDGHFVTPKSGESLEEVLEKARTRIATSEKSKTENAIRDLGAKLAKSLSNIPLAEIQKPTPKMDILVAGLPETLETKLGRELYKQVEPFVKSDIHIANDELGLKVQEKINRSGEAFTHALNESVTDIYDDLAKVKQDLQAAIKLASENNTPKFVEWRVNDVKIAKIEGLHHIALNDVMRRVKANLKNILVVGPAGSGKTTLADNLAKALGLAFASASCSGGMPEWYLTGRSLPDLTTGQSRYQMSDFVRLYENGGVFLLDEMDAADPNVMVVINSALANGHMSIPARVENPSAKRHDKFYLMAAANTYGRGADMQYQGRNALDAATLDRFVGSIITVDYDRKLEERLVPEQEITLRIWEMRDRIMKLGIRRIMGTRALLNAAALFRSGESISDSLTALTIGWTPDEITKVCNNVIPPKSYK